MPHIGVISVKIPLASNHTRVPRKKNKTVYITATGSIFTAWFYIEIK